MLSLAVLPELAQLVVLRKWFETEAYKNDVHLLPTELDEKEAKMRLPALGTVLTVFSDKETKNSSLVELECGMTPLGAISWALSSDELECGTTPRVRGDSATRYLVSSRSVVTESMAGNFKT